MGAPPPGPGCATWPAPPHTPGTTEPRNAQSPLATRGPWRQLRLPVPRGRGPLLGAGSWAGLGRPSTVGGPFLPLHLLCGLRIAWWPVLRHGRGWRVPAASRRRWPPQPQWGPGRQGGRWLQPARGGAGPAGHPQDAALHGGPGTGPAAAAGSPRTVAGPGPLLWQPPGCGHGRHSPFHQDPAPRPPRGDEDSGDCWPAARAGRSVPSSDALSWCPGEDSEGALSQPGEVTGQEGFRGGVLAGRGAAPTLHRPQLLGRGGGHVDAD